MPKTMTTPMSIINCPYDNSQKELRDHVRDCDKCYVGADGGVWYCRIGAMILQNIRKARFFGR